MSTPGHSRTPMTADDHLAPAENGRRCQLFDGELVEMMTRGPSVRRQLVLQRRPALRPGGARGGARDGSRADRAQPRGLTR